MHYHFNLWEGAEFIPDREGGDFATFVAARAEAHASLLDIVGDNIRSGRPALDWQLEIADSNGSVIETITFDYFSAQYLKPAPS